MLSGGRETAHAAAFSLMRRSQVESTLARESRPSTGRSNDGKEGARHVSEGRWLGGFRHPHACFNAATALSLSRHHRTCELVVPRRQTAQSKMKRWGLGGKEIAM